MTDAATPDAAPEPDSTKGSGYLLRMILLIQVAIGLVIVTVDVLPTLPQLFNPSAAPSLTQPILPGDQTRRYTDDWTPDPNRRSTPLPNPGDMPSRLLFTATGETLTITGTIREGDADRFKQSLSQNTSITQIRLHSPGGSVRDALSIGRTLRAANINTVMEAGDICLSACPYIFAAGVARTADVDAAIGVHQHYFGENTVLPAFLAVSNIQRGQGEVMRYLDKMGIDPLVMSHALVTPPDEIYILLPEELTTYNVTTPAP